MPSIILDSHFIHCNWASRDKSDWHNTIIDSMAIHLHMLISINECIYTADCLAYQLGTANPAAPSLFLDSFHKSHIANDTSITSQFKAINLYVDSLHFFFGHNNWCKSKWNTIVHNFLLKRCTHEVWARRLITAIVFICPVHSDGVGPCTWMTLTAHKRNAQKNANNITNHCMKSYDPKRGIGFWI